MLDTTTYTMPVKADRRTHVALAATFCVTIFLSAALLFSVQPMFTKTILPLLGGSSGIWNTAMVFFQALLLGGYLYAWGISRWLPLKFQLPVHLFVVAAGFAFLPLAAPAWTPPSGGMPTLWLLGLFGVSVGVPFFALSANAPLLQRWLSYTDHPDADDPYWLYAVSNLGSLLVLLSYPFWIEPVLTLTAQTQSWSVGYVALAAALGACGIFAMRTSTMHSTVAQAPVAEPLGLRRVAFWLCLAFVPSSLMLGVTNHLANTIAAGPFLWVMPLALYLLTFTLAFSQRVSIGSKALAPFAAFACAAGLFGTLDLIHGMWLVGFHGAVFFTIALFAHTRLVEARPPVSQLPQFYVIMSLGGVLGGAFNALVAPVIFDTVIEYALVLGAALALIPLSRPAKLTRSKLRFEAVLAVVFLVIGFMLTDHFNNPPIMGLMFAVPFGLTVLRINSLQRIGILLAIAAVVGWGPWGHKNVALQDRSFYSSITVKHDTTTDVVEFVHGNTIHNIQVRTPEHRRTPLAYYADGNTFHSALSAVRDTRANPAVAVIGLGAGAMACHSRAGERWTYFEIDPAVTAMAQNPSYFTYMSDCAPGADVVMGDARLTLSQLPEASQDIIFVDAFSSDAIPAHLLTREAMDVYRSRLAPGGVVFFHTSNRLMDISSVVASTATSKGLSAVHIARTRFESHPLAEHVVPSEAVLIGAPARITELRGDRGWRDYAPAPRIRPWSDERYSVIGAVIAGIRNEGGPIDSEAANP